VSKATTPPKRENRKTPGNKGTDHEAAGLLRHLGHYVVIDTDSDYLYMGKLLGVHGPFVTLADADVHDRRESSSMNEKYVLESKKYGLRSNRREVHLRFERIVSYSLLEDVIDY
jgi:hypothetical protein